MLKQKVEEALNDQVRKEAYASFYYLAMATWCDKEGLDGCAKFMHRQSAEEREHMLRLVDYISEVDGHAIVPNIEQPPVEYTSVQDMLQKVYEHERKVTESINDILAICYKENDHNTLNFLQWYVEEQREEEAQMRTILDRVKLIGNGPQSLYYVDKEMERINEQAAAAEGEGGEE